MGQETLRQILYGIPSIEKAPQFAMKSDEECDVVETSMWQLKKMFDLHPRRSTEGTYWGDIDTMFE